MGACQNTKTTSETVKTSPELTYILSTRVVHQEFEELKRGGPIEYGPILSKHFIVLRHVYKYKAKFGNYNI